jgi:hypothetical protein
LAVTNPVGVAANGGSEEVGIVDIGPRVVVTEDEVAALVANWQPRIRERRTDIGDPDLEAAIGSQADHGHRRHSRHLQHSRTRLAQV